MSLALSVCLMVTGWLPSDENEKLPLGRKMIKGKKYFLPLMHQKEGNLIYPTANKMKVNLFAPTNGKI